MTAIECKTCNKYYHLNCFELEETQEEKKERKEEKAQNADEEGNQNVFTSSFQHLNFISPCSNC